MDSTKKFSKPKDLNFEISSCVVLCIICLFAEPSTGYQKAYQRVVSGVFEITNCFDDSLSPFVPRLALCLALSCEFYCSWSSLVFSFFSLVVWSSLFESWSVLLNCVSFSLCLKVLWQLFDPLCLSLGQCCLIVSLLLLV